MQREIERTWKLPGIEVSYLKIRYPKSIIHKYREDSDQVRFHLGLSGDYSFTYHELDTQYELGGGHHNLFYSHGLNLEVENKSDVIETFGIDFDKSAFLDIISGSELLFENIILGIENQCNTLNTPDWGTINPKILAVVQEIINNNYTGELLNLFLKSKIVELLFLCAENYELRSRDQKYKSLSKSETELFVQIKDELESKVQSPPTITELATSYGINEYKLKYGFKALFDTSIYQYVLNKRLILAKSLLLQSQKSLKEIAYDLGYSSPQHFSNHFKHHYGYTPKSVRNTP